MSDGSVLGPIRNDIKIYIHLNIEISDTRYTRQTHSDRVYTTLKMMNLIYTPVTHVFEECEDVTHLQDLKQSMFGPIDLPIFIIKINKRSLI